MMSFGLFKHPKKPTMVIVGYRLGRGETTQKGDIYSAPSGWEQAREGFHFENDPKEVVCIRPILRPVSQAA
jgi:hypothetical protein